jgi:hypothetical protein
MANEPSGIDFQMLRGQRGAMELCASGLLSEVVHLGLPLTIHDVIKVIESDTGFVVIGYVDGSPVGYVVGQLHEPSVGVKHLFIQQAWTKGIPEWSQNCFDFLTQIAQVSGYQGIATTVPLKIAKAVERRYHFRPVGIYMVRPIIGQVN